MKWLQNEVEYLMKKPLNEKKKKQGGGGKEAVTTGSWMGFNPQGEQIQRELSMRRMKD